MSVAMIQAFKSVEGLHPSARLVAYMLADCHNEQSGLCNPSFSYLMRVTSLSERAIRYAVRDLETAGFLSRSGRNGATPNYLLTPATIAPPAKTAPGKECPPPRQPLPPTGATIAETPATIAPKPEITVNRTGIEPEVAGKPKRQGKPKISRDEAESAIPENLDICRSSILQWFDGKAERREHYTPIGWRCLMTSLGRENVDRIDLAIEIALSKGWKGIVFDPKIFNGQTNGHQAKTGDSGWTTRQP